MGEKRSILVRLPQRELEIRRLCTADPGFNSICEDFEEAAEALRYWQALIENEGRKPDTRVISEYQELISELEAEILARLDQAMMNQRPF